MIFLDESAKYCHYQETLESSSYLATTTTRLGNSDKCLLSLKWQWVIAVAIDHITGNYNHFTTFKPSTSSSVFTLAYVTTSFFLDFGTVYPIMLLSQSSILSLLNFSFNSMSRSTCDLNCCVSFFFLIIIYLMILWWRRLLIRDMCQEVSTS